MSYTAAFSVGESCDGLAIIALERGSTQTFDEFGIASSVLCLIGSRCFSVAQGNDEELIIHDNFAECG